MVTLIVGVVRHHGLRGGLLRVLLSLAAWAEHEAYHAPRGRRPCYRPDCEALDRAADWLDA